MCNYVIYSLLYFEWLLKIWFSSGSLAGFSLVMLHCYWRSTLQSWVNGNKPISITYLNRVSLAVIATGSSISVKKKEMVNFLFNALFSYRQMLLGFAWALFKMTTSSTSWSIVMVLDGKDYKSHFCGNVSYYFQCSRLYARFIIKFIITIDSPS